MLNTLGPGNVGNVNQAVDPFIDPDEYAEVGDVLDLAGNGRAHRILLSDDIPRVGFELFHPERNALVFRIDAEHHGFHFVPHIEHLGRVANLFRPGHFGDVDQPLDPFFDFDEGAVIGQADHAPVDTRADGVLALRAGPGIGHQLLEAEGDPLVIAVEAEHHDLDPVPDLEQLGRMSHAAPAHIGDVKQAVDSAQIHEHAVVGDVLDDSFHDLPVFEVGKRLRLHLLALFLEKGPAGENHIAPLLVIFEDLERECLTDEEFKVADRSQVHLGTGQEGLYPDVDRQAALHLGHHLAFDDAVLVVNSADIVPDLDLGRLLLGKVDGAVLIVVELEQNIDIVADGSLYHSLFVLEFVDGNLSFGLVTDIDHDVVIADLHNAPANDLALLDIPKALFVKILHGIHVFDFTLNVGIVRHRGVRAKLGQVLSSHFVFVNH